jgi:hypothetical protein
LRRTQSEGVHDPGGARLNGAAKINVQRGVYFTQPSEDGSAKESGKGAVAWAERGKAGMRREYRVEWLAFQQDRVQKVEGGLAAGTGFRAMGDGLLSGLRLRR